MTWEDFSGLLQNADAVLFLAAFVWLLVFKKAIRLDREFTSLEEQKDARIAFCEERLNKRDEQLEQMRRTHEDELRRTREDYDRRLTTLSAQAQEFKTLLFQAMRLGERVVTRAEEEREP